MVVAADVVLPVSDLADAERAGARFAFSLGIADLMLGKGAIPVIPGIATASKLIRDLQGEITTLKFFPPIAAGGPGNHTRGHGYLCLYYIRSFGAGVLAALHPVLKFSRSGRGADFLPHQGRSVSWWRRAQSRGQAAGCRCCGNAGQRDRAAFTWQTRSVVSILTRGQNSLSNTSPPAGSNSMAAMLRLCS